MVCEECCIKWLNLEPDITSSVPKNKQRNINILENADDFVGEECTESGVWGGNETSLSFGHVKW